MTALTTAPRYSAVAIVLHWAIAFAILFNLVLGFWMRISAEHGGAGAAVFQAFQLHKSVGLSVLALSLARLAWRLTHTPPPLPEAMPAWERAAARATHWAFYVLMIALPLSGWLYVSAGWSHETGRAFSVPTIWFGLVQVPHLFGLTEQSDTTRAALAGGAFTAHYVLAYAAIALALLHVAAALKHHVVNRDEVLAHMVPGLKAANETAPPRNPARAAALGAGLAIAALGAAWLLYTALTLGAAVPPPQAQTQSTPAQPEISAPATTIAPSAPPAAASAPPLWRVDQSASSITFSGVHAETNFRGAFSRWSADIRFDPDNLEASSATVTIETASARDGIQLHDATLPAAEWFDTANHPTATFRTTEITRRGDRYRARGTLTIKGHAISISMPFTLQINGDRAVMDGRVSVPRRDADLGMTSDPDAEWVSAEIGVDVHVVAVRAR